MKRANKELARELSTFLKIGLRDDPEARLVAGVSRVRPDGSRGLRLALGSNVDASDLVEFADCLLLSAREQIANGRHPDCDNCRDNIKRIEEARAVLGVDRPEELSS